MTNRQTREAMTNRVRTKEQRAQEAEYEFPYHYLPRYKPNFSLQRPFAWGLNYVATIEFLLAELEPLDFSTVVDIGCGDGRFAREMAQQFPQRSVVGVDYSVHAIALARAMNPNVQNLAFLAENITENPSVQNMDVAVLMEVLEHIPPAECDRFLAGVASMLRDAGTLLLTVPSTNIPVTEKHFRHFSPTLLCEALGPFFSIEVLMPFEQISIRRNLVAGVLANRFFSLTHKKTCNALYRYYKRTLQSAADTESCQRLYVKAIRK